LDESLFEVEVFRREGFVRKTCKRCGRRFWTLNPDQELCGDQPCVEYGFIGNPPKANSFDKRSLREAFLSFFERNGHGRVRRYPVVARWREDVYLVGASIYDFQPWVTSGIVPPPANPLTISQPSIRFTDLENVGRTGRHLTGFEMMAHHAFNIGGRRVYWNDETVDYCFRFYRDVVGLNPEELTFVEDFWSGGGNAGEDFEVVVRGGEVATLVFMHYKVGEDGSLNPMENMIVDTGYGLERNLWILQGKPNIYETVYGELVEKLRVEAGVEKVDEQILLELSKIAGMMDVKEKKALEEVKSKVASRVGLTLEDVEKLLRPYELIYRIADHSYTLAWMLGDGVVPSNTGAGYLARLLIRRCLRAMDELGLNVDLGWIVGYQLKELAPDFPELLEAEDDIVEMLELEAKRYRESLDRALKIAVRIVRSGKKSLTVDDLIMLYDSHGLPPELLRDRLSPLGVKVDVPRNFYELVAKIHERPEQRRVEEEHVLRKTVGNLPRTRRIYFEDGKVRRFKARVLKVIGDWVILDETAFYPTSGGQLHDTGVLRCSEGAGKVVDVRDVDGVIVHKVEGAKPNVGEQVECEIDWDRRMALTRHHTATHILMGAARKVLGPHVWQTGAEKTVEKARLDITHYKSITREELEQIELLANKVVAENRPVKTFMIPRDEAEKRYGFRLYQGGVYPGRVIRVVEIEGWDAEACGGTHCDRTGEVGLIKIISVDRIQDGVERLEYVAGEQALRHLQARFRILEETSSLLGSPVDKLKESVTKLLEELKAERRRVESLRKKLVEARISSVVENLLEVDGVKLAIQRRVDEETDTVITEANTLVNRFPETVAIYFLVEGGKARIVVMVGDKAKETGLNAGIIARRVATICGGRAGGSARLGQGGGLDASKIPNEKEILEEVLKIKAGTPF